MPSATPSTALARLIDSLELGGHVHIGRTFSEPVRRLPTGVAEIDDLLSGGLPCGRISEIVGSRSSGKTSLLWMLLATATRRGEVVACIDVADALHPPSAAQAGVDLQRLLWVRPPSLKAGMHCAELLLQAGGFGIVALDLGLQSPRGLRAQVWPRLMRTAELSHTPLVVLAPYRVAGSFSVVGLQLRCRNTLWRRGVCSLFDGLQISARVVRNKWGESPSTSRRLSVRNGLH